MSAATGTWFTSGAATPPATSTGNSERSPETPNWYTVYNVAGNKCLDADSAGGGQNGNRIQLWSCNGTVYQQWYVWSPNGGDTIYLQNGNGLRYLDVATETAGENNGRVQLWDWNGGRADEEWSTPEP
ncbi:RICIN domain-containing protein [Streptomyces mirabilis]|uniref:RICIN domain-containing protein n=1 Tax=Streptomyces mirabilis TaxID=68239 RepID=UPI00369E49DB